MQAWWAKVYIWSYNGFHEMRLIFLALAVIDGIVLGLWFFSDECGRVALSRWRSGRWCTWLWPTTTAWSTAERPWPSSERSNRWWRTLGCCCWTCECSRTISRRLSLTNTYKAHLYTRHGRVRISFMLSCFIMYTSAGFSLYYGGSMHKTCPV